MVKYRPNRSTMEEAMEDAKEMLNDPELKELAAMEFEEAKEALPKIEEELNNKRHYYTNEEIDKIIDRFKDNATFVASFLTSCYTGMRTGEVFALTWEDIDLENGIINIRHNLYDKPKDSLGRWYLGTTKTISGTRQIYIGKTLITALKNYKERQEYLKEVFGKDYKYYHLETITNDNGKVVDKRIVFVNNYAKTVGFFLFDTLARFLIAGFKYQQFKLFFIF